MNAIQLDTNKAQKVSMRFLARLRGLNVTIAAGALAFFILTGGAPAAHAKVFRATVEGLPSGLLVQFIGQWSCFLDNAQTFMTEQSYTTWEVVTVFGRIELRQVTHIRYVGEINKTRPANPPPCGTESGITLDETDFDAIYFVFGRDDGNIRFKFAQKHYEVSPNPAIQENISHRVEAKSTSLVISGTSNVPTTVTKGQLSVDFETWNATYSDAFGFPAIRNPSLDFTQTVVNPLGFLTSQSRVKMWITDSNQACLRVAGETECKAISEGGNLSNNGVTLSVGSLVIQGSQIPGGGNGNELTITWRFRFSLLPTLKNPPFGPIVPPQASGNYSVVVSADDRDLDGYFDGSGFTSEVQPLNILPWRSISIPVVVQ